MIETYYKLCRIHYQTSDLFHLSAQLYNRLAPLPTRVERYICFCLAFRYLANWVHDDDLYYDDVLQQLRVDRKEACATEWRVFKALDHYINNTTALTVYYDNPYHDNAHLVCLLCLDASVWITTSEPYLVVESCKCLTRRILNGGKEHATDTELIKALHHHMDVLKEDHAQAHELTSTFLWRNRHVK